MNPIIQRIAEASKAGKTIARVEYDNPIHPKNIIVVYTDGKSDEHFIAESREEFMVHWKDAKRQETSIKTKFDWGPLNAARKVDDEFYFDGPIEKDFSMPRKSDDSILVPAADIDLPIDVRIIGIINDNEELEVEIIDGPYKGAIGIIPNDCAK